jgi:hypothetical protein
VPAIPDSVRALLESGALAHLVMLEPDGRPQVPIVWLGVDGDELVNRAPARASQGPQHSP